MKTFLENVLRTMNDGADVQVMLNSVTVYDSGFEMVDCCGNHRTMHWIKAIQACQLYAKLVVKNVSVEPMYGESGRVQWVIELANTKMENCTQQLAYYANEFAIAELWDS